MNTLIVTPAFYWTFCRFSLICLVVLSTFLFYLLFVTPISDSKDEYRFILILRLAFASLAVVLLSSRSAAFVTFRRCVSSCIFGPKIKWEMLSMERRILGFQNSPSFYYENGWILKSITSPCVCTSTHSCHRPSVRCSICSSVSWEFSSQTVYTVLHCLF